MGTDWKHSIQEEGGAEALGMTMGMFHWFERTSWKLARAEDGSLLMRKSEGGSLMLYWFPVLPGWETPTGSGSRGSYRRLRPKRPHIRRVSARVEGRNVDWRSLRNRKPSSVGRRQPPTEPINPRASSAASDGRMTSTGSPVVRSKSAGGNPSLKRRVFSMNSNGSSGFGTTCRSPVLPPVSRYTRGERVFSVRMTAPST